MLGRLRMDVNTAIRQYDDIAKHAFSDVKLLGGDGKFEASKLEEAIKSVVEGITGNSGSPLLEGNEAKGCRTWVHYLSCYALDSETEDSLASSVL